ncbi:MAG: hypothetical protein V3V62_10390 [bacterium]
MAVLLAGCASPGPSAKKEKAGLEEEGLILTDWVPLGLTSEAFAAANKRLRKEVHVGMPRREFLRKMELNPIPGTEWTGRMTSGEGWFSELSRKNMHRGLEMEEFPFGYYQGKRLKERFAVILRNRVVARIVRSPWSESRRPPSPPDALLSSPLPVKEENRLIGEFYRKRLQSRAAYERILPHLKRIRPGWTSADLRLALGGSLYRLSNGLVLFQEGLLWDHGFKERRKGASSTVLLPFGFRGRDGKVNIRVIVQAEDGLVTAVFWQALSSAKGRRRE